MKKTHIINNGIERKRGKLLLNKEVLFSIVARREEQQKGKERMSGYVYEDMGKEWQTTNIRQPIPPHKRFLFAKPNTTALKFHSHTSSATHPMPQLLTPNLVGEKTEGRGSALKGALGKCGGDKQQLAEGIKAGRILRTQKQGLIMYWFPKFEYSRENLFRKALEGQSEKGAASFDAMKEAEDSQFGYTWEANSIINEGLGGGPVSLPSSSTSKVLPFAGGPCSTSSSSASTSMAPLQDLVLGAGYGTQSGGGLWGPLGARLVLGSRMCYHFYFVVW